MLLSELIDLPALPRNAPPSVPTASTPALLCPADVGGDGAWRTMLHDGVIQRVHLDTAVAAGTEITATVRAASLAPLVPTNCYVAGSSAVWVYCGGPIPPVLTIAHALGTARPHASADRLVFSGAGLWAESQLLGLGKYRVRVTTMARTAIDQALRADPATAKQQIRALQAAGLDLFAAARALEFRGHTARRPEARVLFADLLTEQWDA